jgi:ribonuclease P protein subunit POP4
MQSIPLVKDEFIGLQVSINKSSDPTWINQQGIIVDETKNTFLIQTNNKVKRIAKNIATFTFIKNKEKISILGSKIRYRPEDRVKKAR